MTGEAASSPKPGFALAREASWQDELWLMLVGSVDQLLRAYIGIDEFTDDPGCVFRLELHAARGAVMLSDGTDIRAGEPVGVLHLWNEHLRPYAAGGPDFGWACDMRRRVRRSLQLLAEYVERDPGWRAVRAFRGNAALSRRLGNTQIRRVAARYGFEAADAPSSVLRELHFIGDCCNAWALTRAFNPAALARHGFLRGRCELWITRRRLVERYARQPHASSG